MVQTMPNNVNQSCPAVSFNSSMTSFFSATAWRSFASTKFIRWNSPRTCSALSTET